MIAASVVVTVAADHRVLACVDSFVRARGSLPVEFLLACGDTPPELLAALQSLVDAGAVAGLLHLPGRSRCYRKDAAADEASSNFLIFVDSDCLFHSSYFLVVLPLLRPGCVLRGQTEFRARPAWFSRLQCTYRITADRSAHSDESFTPNLVIDRTVLRNVGGWWDGGDSIDPSDDFALSDRLRTAGYRVQVVPDLVVTHEDDPSASKTIRTWYGYGLGFAFRRAKAQRRHLVWPTMQRSRYRPPFMLARAAGLGYTAFALVQYLVVSLGFVVGLLRFGRGPYKSRT